VQIRSFVIPAPPLSEQCAIAVAISDIEALINSLERLIAKKTDIKQAAMQQLLTGKTRLPGFKKKDGFKHSGIGLIPQDWDVKTLGELGTFKNGINKGQEDFGHGFPFVNLMDVFGKPRVSNDADFGLVNSSTAERKMYELNKDDVLFVRSSVKPDGVGLTTFVCQDLPNTVFSGFLIRFRPSGHLAGEFMEHCFANQEFRKRVISSSTVSANTNINQHALRALALAFPPDKHEQIAIGTYLSDMDAELSRLAERRDKTLLIKQGMVQELLTGRTRLI
jgi:type I restriction enzyme S subunit